MAERMKPTEVTPDEEKLQKFINDLTKDADVTDDQREAANEDMRFINVPGGMWEGEFEDFGNRCKLELDKCSDYLQRFIGEWNQNRTGVLFKADDDKTTEDDAELLNGIYRADFKHSNGKLATDNAVDEVATCGYGAMSLTTAFVDEEDPENDDQRIEWRPIYNAYNTVIWDKAAKRIDKSDARWCTVLAGMAKDEFENEYPDMPPVSALRPDSLFNRSLTEHSSDLIFVATRYEVVRRRRTVFVYNNLGTGEREIYDVEDHEREKARLKADVSIQFVRKRKLIRQSVEKTVFSGKDILDETRDINGRHIPIIPFYGYRSYVDGVETYRGVVRKLKDACRLFNMLASQWAENSASTGSDTPIFETDQMDGKDIQDIWADRSTKPYLLVKPRFNEDGTRAPSGPIGYLKAPQLDGSTVALASTVSEYIQGITGGAPQETLDPNVSGKALKALLKRENMGTQVINDNIANAIARSGVVYQSMASDVYRSQKNIKIITVEGEEAQKQLFQNVVEDGKLIQINRLDNKRFHAYADTGPQYETLREETVEDMKGMIELFSKTRGGEPFMSAALSVLLNNITGVGLEPIKELNRKIMLGQGLIKPESDEDQRLLAEFQQSQQPNENDKLLEAAAEQQLAEARSLDASSVQKLADADKKGAETMEILSDIDISERKLALEARQANDNALSQILGQLRALPVN